MTRLSNKETAIAAINNRPKEKIRLEHWKGGGRSFYYIVDTDTLKTIVRVSRSVFDWYEWIVDEKSNAKNGAVNVCYWQIQAKSN